MPSAALPRHHRYTTASRPITIHQPALMEIYIAQGTEHLEIPIRRCPNPHHNHSVLDMDLLQYSGLYFAPFGSFCWFLLNIVRLGLVLLLAYCNCFECLVTITEGA
jgi:hypothetical protein